MWCETDYNLTRIKPLAAIPASKGRVSGGQTARSGGKRDMKVFVKGLVLAAFMALSLAAFSSVAIAQETDDPAGVSR